MENPVVHALVFLAAVIIPGGLLVYFAWRATRSISLKGEPNQTGQNEGFGAKDEVQPTPEEALEAYLTAFPKYSQESLRARSRAKQLHVYKTRPRKKSQ
jgi:hypothetical protein